MPYVFDNMMKNSLASPTLARDGDARLDEENRLYSDICFSSDITDDGPTAEVFTPWISDRVSGEAQHAESRCNRSCQAGKIQT